MRRMSDELSTKSLVPSVADSVGLAVRVTAISSAGASSRLVDLRLESDERLETYRGVPCWG